MSNLTVGGYDSFRARHFSYYETIAGGAGAAPGHPGTSGIHTHMTNTLNTPIEALEAYYPMRVTEYRDPARLRAARAISPVATGWCASSNASSTPTSAC